MRIVGRTVSIVVAALIVCGVTWGIGRSITVMDGPRGERPVAGQTQGATGEGFQRGERPEGDGPGGGLFGIVQVVQPLVIIAIIVGLGHLMLRVLRRRFPTPADRRKVPPRSPA